MRSFCWSFWVGDPLSFPQRIIWRVGDPKKVSFLSWTAALGAILTKIMYRRLEGLWLTGATCAGTIVINLLLHCEFVWQLPGMVFV